MSERIRILVVDDDYAVRTTLVGVLSRDYELSSASSGEEALNFLLEEKKAGKKFGAVLTDVDMPPGISGIEFVRLLKANELAAGALIVVMSGGDRTAEDLAVIKESGAEFLQKPIYPIRETVAGLLAKGLVGK